jgi:superfamily II DNA or RNA helicase
MSEQLDQNDVIELYGDKPLRWYQIASRNEIIKHIEEGFKRIFLLLPTGAGKTITSACLLGSDELRRILNINDRKLKVLFIAHMHRLLTQAEQTFATENNVELIVQSMMSPISQDTIDYGWDIVVLDECHHESCMSMQYQLEQIGGDKPIIGLSASSERPDGLVMKFEVTVAPISRQQAVDEGYLAETYLNTFVDGSERSKAEIIIDILKQYADQMEGTLIFVRTHKEIDLVNNYLVNNGYKSVGISTQSKKEVDNLLNQFSDGEIQFIVSANKLSEGIDIKRVHDVITVPVGSLSILNQRIGRAARPDCPCRIWEIVNPLAKDNLDTTCIVAPIEHNLYFIEKGQWVVEQFDYSSI